MKAILHHLYVSLVYDLHHPRSRRAKRWARMRHAVRNTDGRDVDGADERYLDRIGALFSAKLNADCIVDWRLTGCFIIRNRRYRVLHVIRRNIADCSAELRHAHD